ncbi:helix-turn-helix transcriptional regulator [Pseudovibrio sp. Alg231-02]|uniref:helix-turn-helix transcriptional regulator n=1 Tax=Pseudovibrio sp. Alg231-02 TaxID=1922223 RepID=UPI0018FF1332|nr:hypothetical protein [Pseudovibrio sp. Alg231-02]
MQEPFRKKQISPRGLNKTQAANYIGVSAGLFERMIQQGLMPSARQIASRKVWDIQELDRAFDDLPHVNGEAFNHSEGAFSDFV